MEPMRPPEPALSTPRAGVLRRSNGDRVIAGVVGGIAAYLGLDSKLLRIGWLIMALFGGGVAAYLVAWFVLPDEAEQRTSMPAVLLLLFLVVPFFCGLCAAAISVMSAISNQGYPNY